MLKLIVLVCSLILSATVSALYEQAKPSAACLNAFNTAILAQHNHYRQLHSDSPLTVDVTIQASAQNYSDYLTVENLFQHSHYPGLGENLYDWSGQKWANNQLQCWYGDNAADCAAVGTAAVDAWYKEIAQYNFKNPGFSMTTGHFTQVVWKSTTKVGCGLGFNSSTCTNKVVCEYSPPGNVVAPGYFAANVLPATSG